MTFYCINCSSPLVNIGLVNQFMCEKCKCIYEVKIELRLIKRVTDENIRKLPAAGNSKDNSE